MSTAKDFQLATAKRIIEIFKSGQKRVLLSDEVGLGKTIMAKTVVEMAKTLPGVEKMASTGWYMSARTKISSNRTPEILVFPKKTSCRCVKVAFRCST